jgi:hypothetical protein
MHPRAVKWGGHNNTPIVPGGGVPSNNSNFVFFLGKTRRGGTKIPEAPIHVITVTKSPLSANDRVANSFFFPFRAITLLVLCCTALTPVSSTLNRQFGENFIFPSPFQKFQRTSQHFQQ